MATAGASAARRAPGRAVIGALLIVAGSRLAIWGFPQFSDEIGYRFVAEQWHDGLGSLYGAYWVDRPPLLMELFALAAPIGATGVRLAGLVASVMVVLTAAGAAGAIAGPRARAGAALVAAVLIASPLSGSTEVDGELLALPFATGGIWAWIAASKRADARTSSALAMLAGGLGIAALLVKQNFADVAVFAAVSLVVSPPRHRLRLIAHAAGGALVVTVGVLAAAWQRGTSPLGAFDAMYPFRVEAGKVLSRNAPPSVPERLHEMLAMAAGSVLPVMVLIAALLLLRRHRSSEWRAERWWVALGVVVAFDVASIALGGNYWPHYLVQLIGPLAVLAGVCCESLAGWVGVSLIGAMSAVGGVALAVTTTHASVNPGTTVGSAIGAAARPGDTVTALYGEPALNASSGLSSPYPYLWSLPTKVRDPQLALLEATLAGPDAPTWLVVVRKVPTWGVPTAQTARMLDRRYRPIERICGMTIYLQRGVDRPKPDDACHPPATAITRLAEIVR
jgi:hypothetical protein